MTPRKEALLALARGQGWRRAQEALRKLLQEYPNELLARDFLSLIRCFGRQSAWQSSIEAFDCMKQASHQPSELHYTAAMRSCTLGGEDVAPMALRLFSEMSEPGAMGFTAAISSCGVAKEWELAISLLHAMAGAQHPPDLLAFNALLTSLRRAGKSKLALRCMEALRHQDLQPDVMAYSAAISACEESSRWHRAIGFLKEMQRDTVPPNVVSFSSAISASTKARQWDQALWLLSEMRDGEVQPNVVAFSAVLAACDKAGQWQWTLNQWMEMKKTGLRPNRMSFCAFVGSLGRGLHWQQALDCLDHMWRSVVTPDLRNYTVTLSALENSKQWQWALELLSDMSHRKLHPDLICRSIVKRARFKGTTKGRVSSRLKLSAAIVVRSAMGKDEDLLPADIKKEVKQKVNFVRRQPKKGDEVEIHYTASAGGVLLDTSCTGQPIQFTMGSGNVMEAWDRIVSTMRKGEISRFTVPEMYLTGGPSQFLAKLPDDGQEVDYDIELVSVVGIRDIFGDGSVIERIHDDGEEYGISPKAGDELQINYELCLKNGQVLDSRQGMDFRMASHADNSVLCSKAIQKSLETFKLKSCGTLICRSDYSERSPASEERFNIPPKEDLVIKVQLLEIYEFEDCGKKAFWEDGLVLKKAIKPQRCRLCPGFDGTWCKVKICSATVNQEELLEEQVIETTVGLGELCDAMEAACSAMRKGEVALVTVKDLSLLTPGKPVLKVPSEGLVVFKLEMLDFGSPGPEEGPSENLLLLNLAKKVKEKGSEHFKAGRFRLAQERYSRVIQLLPRYKKPLGSTTNIEVFTEWVEKKTAEELKRSSRLNLAACALKLGLHYAAARHADDVLKEDPKNLKALYRRAQGALGANDFDVATKDCKRILDLEPENKDAILLLRKVRYTEKEQDKAQREQFGATLGRKLG